MSGDQVLLSKRDAAAALAMSERRLQDLVSAGAIAAKRDGASVKFLPSELQRWAASLPSWEPRSA